MLEFEKVKVGDVMSLVKEPVNEIQLVRYAGASGDFNPLHFMDSVGKSAGRGGVIAHGMLIMGFVGQAVTDWVPRRNLKNLKVRFVNVTLPGDIITVSARVVDKKVEADRGVLTCEVTAANQNGQVKLSGSFTAEL